METEKQRIRELCTAFRLGGISNGIKALITEAEQQEMGYVKFLSQILETEATHRSVKDLNKREKAAWLPQMSDLNHYKTGSEDEISPGRLKQLRELNWVDQLFNIVLMGPSGTGKTFLAAGLCQDAVKAGYNAYFRRMDDLVNMLKTKDFVKTQQVEYKRLLKANLLVIDDIMLFPLEKNLAISFFNFINQIYESTSIIITTNKKPSDWSKQLDDEVIATALLDRLLYHCEVINFSGESYRLKNRKTIFEGS
ncbi:IS21-like element helper ATPase IstB [Chitinophaga sancti]|uniref:IS21-like element helper ATPase IstB n=3 Tax=Chitinophaga sancti TaxID=1004 RepID=A0ABZ0XCE4_9BACT|nr:IS21-like element helper ATPase IstB [Chitinophaga sancti]WQD59602.1 IS21-like element helper ATPase IstB [Chitinophaga sancti]WQD59630.1 IS21-like element helper ATPase IstB [Chitinophaga sancti]WQD61423.1 IS21-like element helper ATPase IstB [Chitinophaga sancti]WQG88239.1 IS21-like element helper ATPase IstB [Chitinophaga sancti]WQG88265.1 IS21-like element helper ATPase IstB [Chitinophaga sancti]